MIMNKERKISINIPLNDVIRGISNYDGDFKIVFTKLVKELLMRKDREGFIHKFLRFLDSLFHLEVKSSLFHLKNAMEMTTIPSRVKIIVYGTLITSPYRFNFLTSKICKVRGWKRVCANDQGAYPFVIPDDDNEFLALVKEIRGKDIFRIDDYENVSGGLYKRVTTKILTKDENGEFTNEEEAFIYVPTRKTIEQRVNEITDDEDRWLSYMRKCYPRLKELYPEFFEGYDAETCDGCKFLRKKNDQQNFCELNYRWNPVRCNDFATEINDDDEYEDEADF